MFSVFNISICNSTTKIVICYDCKSLVSFYLWRKHFFYELGIEEAEIDGLNVRVYDLEKSVCDAIEYRNKIGLDVSFEIFKSYLAHKDRDISRLYEYAYKLRVGKRLMN